MPLPETPHKVLSSARASGVALGWTGTQLDAGGCAGFGAPAMLSPPRPAGAGWPAVGGVCRGVAGGAAWESAFRAVPNTAQTTSIDFRIALTESPGISHGAAARS